MATCTKDGPSGAPWLRPGASRAYDSNVSKAYDLAQSMGTALTYVHAHRFLTSDRSVMVSTPAHAVATLKGGYAVSHTFLGPAHPVTVEFRKLVKWLDANQMLLQQTWQNFTSPLIFPTAMVFYFHRDLSLWINYQLVTDSDVPPPNFMEWTFRLSRQDQWYRGLPAALETTSVAASKTVTADDTATMVIGLTEASSESTASAGGTIQATKDSLWRSQQRTRSPTSLPKRALHNH